MVVASVAAVEEVVPGEEVLPGIIVPAVVVEEVTEEVEVEGLAVEGTVVEVPALPATVGPLSMGVAEAVMEVEDMGEVVPEAPRTPGGKCPHFFKHHWVLIPLHLSRLSYDLAGLSVAQPAPSNLNPYRSPYDLLSPELLSRLRLLFSPRPFHLFVCPLDCGLCAALTITHVLSRLLSTTVCLA